MTTQSHSVDSFEGKVALITGGASGIGAATSRLLAAGGASVVIADINLEHAEETVASIVESGGTASAIRVDVGIPEDSLRAVEHAQSLYGGLHFALNNVTAASVGKRVGETDVADWQRVMEIALNGVFYGLRYELPAIEAAGGGSIVNVASIAGLWGTYLNAGYVTAKHAIIGLTKATALEYARGDAVVRVNAVCPGYIDTPLMRGNASAERVRTLQDMHPVGRLGDANEVAELIVFLLSDRASFITGSAHVVDGGFTAGYRGTAGRPQES